MKFYKIQNTNTNLYCSAAFNPTWNKRGHIWVKIGTLKSYIENVKKTHNTTSWQIVEINLVEGNKYLISSL